MKTFLICPVRNVKCSDTEGIVKILESNGWDVHWPPRDTNQNDKIGYAICSENLKAIKESEVIHIVWDGKSQGCLFDLGMAFALNKKIVTVKIPNLVNGEKSFQNMITFWEMSEKRKEEIIRDLNNHEYPDFPL